MDNSKIWVVSDTHFYHRNIIKYCGRPFETVEEMNEQLIKNWNSLVKKNDRLFHLGDFCLGGKSKIIEIGQQLNGRKTLILGNHDGAAQSTYCDAGFEMVSKYPIFLREYQVILSHEPIVNAKYINIHGHLHEKTVFDLEEFAHLCTTNYLNVSIDRTDYKPVLLTGICNKKFAKPSK